ncbi:Hypothetical predicted protein, partial [Scomber scombrus]
PHHCFSVSCQIHVMGNDVIFSCHVIDLLINDVADIEHNRPDCVEVWSEYSAWRKKKTTKKYFSS